MKQILADIQSGEFAREWIAENRAGGENFNRMREEAAGHQIEKVGEDLRVDDALDRPGVLGPPPAQDVRLVPRRVRVVGTEIHHSSRPRPAVNPRAARTATRGRRLPGRLRCRAPGRVPPLPAAGQVAAGDPALLRPRLRRHRRLLRPDRRLLRRPVHGRCRAGCSTSSRRRCAGAPRHRLRPPAHRRVPAVLARRGARLPGADRIDYPEHMDNWRPLVHWLLVIPYMFVAGVLVSVAGIVSFIAIFAILFTEGAPGGHVQPDRDRPLRWRRAATPTLLDGRPGTRRSPGRISGPTRPGP